MENCASHLLVVLFLFAALLSGTMLSLNTEKPFSEIRMMENSGIFLLIILSTRFSVHFHYEKKESFRQFSFLSGGSRHTVLAMSKQQIGGCSDLMVSDETRPGEMELTKIK